MRQPDTDCTPLRSRKRDFGGQTLPARLVLRLAASRPTPLRGIRTRPRAVGPWNFRKAKDMGNIEEMTR